MIPPFDRRVLEATLRRDFGSFVHKAFNSLSPGQVFVPGFYIDAIVYQLERMRRGEITRLIINMPPRSLKSVIASVAFPAFVLGHDPTQRIICVSYSSDLARRFSNDFRALIEQHWYRRIFSGARISRYKDSETEIELTQRGFRLATSVGGTLTGRGGNLLILDDPMKPRDALSDSKRAAVNDWFSHTLLSRLDNKRSGKILIVMQRLHIDDLSGFVLSQSDEWTVLSLPAIAELHENIPLGFGRVHRSRPGDLLAPEREPQFVLDELRKALGGDVFSAQYQQAPVPPGGAMVKRRWVQRYTEAPFDRSTVVVQSWDTAAKGGPDNDWSVCTTWASIGEYWYLLDVWRERVDYPTLKLKVRELAELWRADTVLVEESGTAVGLLAELKYEVRGLIGVKPDRDKISRMSVASAMIEAGQVFFPERASWLAEFERELFAFPGSKFDDQVDSVSQALNHGKSGVWVWARV
jgi:predicted phage terminase large subunit-like protein